MIDTIIQIGIVLTGIPAIWLLNNGYRFGAVIGLFGQIFWFMTAFRSKEWGIFVLCLFYTYSWACGVYNWIKERNNDDKNNKKHFNKYNCSNNV